MVVKWYFEGGSSRVGFARDVLKRVPRPRLDHVANVPVLALVLAQLGVEEVNGIELKSLGLVSRHELELAGTIGKGFQRVTSVGQLCRRAKY